MSYKVSGWVMGSVKIPPTKKMILWTLADRANDDGGGARPAIDTMADAVCTTRRTVQRTLRELEEEGRIVAEGKHEATGCTIYRVVVPWYSGKGVKKDELRKKRGDNLAQGGATKTTNRGDNLAHKPSPRTTSVVTDVTTPPELFDGEEFREAGQSSFTDPVAAVFEFWQETMEHPRAKLDATRRRKIERALKDGYGVEELKLAVSGARQSEWHRGKNPEGKIWDGLTMILRDSEQIEKFMQIASGPQPNVKRDRHRLGQTTIDDDAVFAKGRRAINGGRP